MGRASYNPEITVRPKPVNGLPSAQNIRTIGHQTIEKSQLQGQHDVQALMIHMITTRALIPSSMDIVKASFRPAVQTGQ